MQYFTLRGQCCPIILSALLLLSISLHVNAQPNISHEKGQILAFTTHKRLPAPTVPALPSPPPPLTVVPITPPVNVAPPPMTQPPLLASTPIAPPQGAAAAAATGTAAGICATPLEFLQCRDNVGTFLAAMQVSKTKQMSETHKT